jgi:hypothetical protein
MDALTRKQSQSLLKVLHLHCLDINYRILILKVAFHSSSPLSYLHMALYTYRNTIRSFTMGQLT